MEKINWKQNLNHILIDNLDTDNEPCERPMKKSVQEDIENFISTLLSQRDEEWREKIKLFLDETENTNEDVWTGSELREELKNLLTQSQSSNKKL